MWRYLVGAGAAALLIVAGMVLQAARPAAPLPLVSKALPAGQQAPDAGTASDVAVPEATPATREQKRFNRYDKDRNGSIAREEYLAPRRKAFARLDRNGDGVLSFDEWAAKTTTKFDTADKDKSGALTPSEFATTAVRRKSAAKRPTCSCGTKPAAAGTDDSPDES